MRPEAVAASPAVDRRRKALPKAWRAPLARLALAWVALVALFAGDWRAIVRLWWDVATYNHMLLVPAILAWLVWQRLDQLARLRPSIWWPGLIAVAGAAFVWLPGAFTGLDLARQTGAVALLAAVVPLLLGPRVTAGLIFPLAYMMFLIPSGQELVGVLQTLTAKITVALVHISGIPARIDGVFIATPAGLFEVAEACSGMKFLIAMIAFGVLMANVCFVGRWRRAALLVVCVVVPILANGVRAWGTIYAAQLFGVELAAGFDHIVYGWFFFAFVIALVIACAWPFFDRALDAPMIDAAAIEASPMLSRLAAMRIGAPLALVATLGIVLAAQSWAARANRLVAPLPAVIDLPQVPGWQRVAVNPRIWWEPRAAGADHRLLGRYADAAGHRVDVFYALYASQGEGHEAGAFGEGALRPDTPWAWQGSAEAVAGGNAERLLGEGRVQRLAVTWYRTGALVTGSNARLKLAATADRLFLRARPTMLLIVSAEDAPGIPAAASVGAFVTALGAPGPWMDRIGYGAR